MALQRQLAVLLAVLALGAGGWGGLGRACRGRTGAWGGAEHSIAMAEAQGGCRGGVVRPSGGVTGPSGGAPGAAAI